MSGETPGAREAMDRMVKRLVSDGTLTPKKAREIARKAALKSDRKNK